MADEKISPVPEKSLLEKLIDGTDKIDATFRASIGESLGDTNVPSVKEIMTGKGYYDIDRLRQLAEKNTGLDLYAGERGKDNPWYDDTINFVADAAGYITLSPTSALMGGIGKLGKLAGVAKETIGGVRGGVLGAMTGDTPFESAKNAVIGAALGAKAPGALKAAGKYVGTKGSEAIGSYVKGKYPKVFEGTDMTFNQAYELSKSAKDVLAEIGTKVRELDSNMGFYDLPPEEARNFSAFLDSANSRMTQHRNAILGGQIKEAANIVDIPVKKSNPNLEFYVGRGTNESLGLRYIDDTATKTRYAYNSDGRLVKKRSYANPKAGKIGSKATRVDSFVSPEVYDTMATKANGRKWYKLSDEALGEATTRSNTFVGKLVQEELATISNPELTKNVNNWVRRNRELVGDYNKEMFKRKGAKHHAVVPLDFHTLDVIVPDYAKKLAGGEDQYSSIFEGFVKRTKETVNDAGLTLQDRLRREADIFYKNYLTKDQKEALRIVAGVAAEKAQTPGDMTKILNTWDSGTGFLKQQQLAATHSWISNNFVDNIVKAYMVGGGSAAGKAAGAQTSALFRFGDGLTKDLLKLTDPRNAGPVALKLETPLVKLGQKYGVVADDFFSEAFNQGSEAYLSSRVGVQKAKDILKTRDKKGIAAVYKMYQDALKSTIGRTGSLIEQSARLTTFNHVAKDLISNPGSVGLGLSDEAKNLIKTSGIKEAASLPEVDKILRRASDIVNNAFFDYGNVNLFEKEVMKRIIPYYTYSSRSLPFWLDAATQGQHADRVIDVMGLYKSLGRKPTPQERMQVPDYMLEQGVRIGENGKLVSFPALSLGDAVATVNLKDSVLSKLHPVISLAKTLLTKKTSYGAPIYPSDTRSGLVKSSAPLLEALTPDKLTKVVRDPKKGNAKYTASDLYAFAEQLQKNLVPVPIIDTILRGIEKGTIKGESLEQILGGIGPIKAKTQDRRTEVSTRKRRLRAARDKRRKQSKYKKLSR